jgi:hypothetical protein
MEEMIAGDWMLLPKATIKVNGKLWPQGHGVYMGSKLAGTVLMPVKSDRKKPRVLIQVANVHHGALPHDINPYGYQVNKNGKVPWHRGRGGGEEGQ